MSARESKESDLIRMVLGGIASTTAQSTIHPVDISKIRMQMRGELGQQTRNYASIPHSIYLIYRNEGIASVYKGLAAAVIRETVYSSLRTGLYEPIKRLFGETDPAHTPFWKKILSGGSAGTIASSLCTPFDLVKVRCQAWEGQRQSIIWHVRQLMQERGGVLGLWKGFRPTVYRGALVNATQMPVYDQSKHFLINNGLAEDNRRCHFASSMIAGVACAITTSPIDLVKTRMMNARDDAKYTSVFDCFRKTMKTEGIRALYRGFNAQWMRLGPFTIIQFMVWEQLRKSYGMRGI